jgi:hypothetical protein
MPKPIAPWDSEPPVTFCLTLFLLTGGHTLPAEHLVELQYVCAMLLYMMTGSFTSPGNIVFT